MYRDPRDETIRQLTAENTQLKGQNWIGLGFKYLLKYGLPLTFVASFLVFMFGSTSFYVHQKTVLAERFHSGGDYYYRDAYGKLHDIPQDKLPKQPDSITTWELLDYSLPGTFIIFGIGLFAACVACFVYASDKMKPEKPEEKKA